MSASSRARSERCTDAAGAGLVISTFLIDRFVICEAIPSPPPRIASQRVLFFRIITHYNNKNLKNITIHLAISIIIAIFAIEIRNNMIYKGIDIQRKDANYVPGPLWKMCGYDYDYGMFRSKTPRDYAVLLIHSVFTDEEIRNKRFIYLPRTYRGRQSMKDSIEIYFTVKL